MRWLIYPLLLGQLSICLASSNCTVPSTPLSFPISNVTLSGSSARRGFGVQLGTPGQSMGLVINADWNNSVIYTDNGQCTSLNTAECTFYRGGGYDSTKSSTFEFLNSNEAEFRPADKGALEIIVFGTDTLTLNASNTIPSFPVFTPPTNQLPTSGLGLGRNSTFIDLLYNSGRIASRTWSLFWGLEGGSPSSQMDGTLVLGGYDAAKTTGSSMTQSFSTLDDMDLCPSSMIVFIADVTVNFPNGTTVSLFGQSAGTAIRSCVKPDIPLITFPQTVWDSFSSCIGGTYTAPSESYKLWGMDYATSGVFDGDLSFTFSNGLIITVPNEQLVVPDVLVDSTGETYIQNSSVREILVYNYEDSNKDDMPLLGQAFLTSAYLHVNNDKEEFTLWQANPTHSESLVNVISGDRCTGGTVGGKGNSTSTDGSGNGSSEPSNSPNSGRTLIIVAGVVASVVGLLIIAGSIYGLRWWRRRRTQPFSPTDSSFEENRFSKAELYGSATEPRSGVLKAELDAREAVAHTERARRSIMRIRFSRRIVPAEMDARTMIHEMPVEGTYYEMSAERTPRMSRV